MSTSDALAALHSLYDRAGDDDMTHSTIQMEVKKLDVLSKGDLDAVAQEFGLSKAKTKKDALAAFERKIADRRRVIRGCCRSTSRPIVDSRRRFDDNSTVAGHTLAR